jgi:hypothetical protein
MPAGSLKLLNAVTTTVSSDAFQLNADVRDCIAFQATLTAGTASVDILASIDGVNFCATPVATISFLSGGTDGKTTGSGFYYYKAVVTAISGGGNLTVLASN